jgi:hypothetical protein
MEVIFYEKKINILLLAFALIFVTTYDTENPYEFANESYEEKVEQDNEKEPDPYPDTDNKDL